MNGQHVRLATLFKIATEYGLRLDSDGVGVFASGPTVAIEAMTPLLRANRSRLAWAIQHDSEACRICLYREAVLEAALATDNPMAITQAAHQLEDHLLWHRA